jgi:hypothetical protein
MIHVNGTRELTGVLGHGAPVPGAVLLDVGNENNVLLRRPRPFLDTDAIIAAWRRPHAACLSYLSE